MTGRIGFYETLSITLKERNDPEQEGIDTE
jgi:hypothetical protein